MANSKKLSQWLHNPYTGEDQAKRLIAAGDYVFVPRGKNLQALSDHGLTVKDAKDEMLGLMVGDYFKGPKQDFDRSQPGEYGSLRKLLTVNSFM